MHICNISVLTLNHRVDGEWIVAKKDWQEAKKRHKVHEKHRSGLGQNDQRNRSATTPPPTGSEENTVPSYEPDMDEMRCFLYTHGGEWTSRVACCKDLQYM
jgi:hypothetical protein